MGSACHNRHACPLMRPAPAVPRTHPVAPLPLAGTKIIATIGPSCHEVDQLQELLEAGASGARFDLTWGPLEFHK